MQINDLIFIIVIFNQCHEHHNYIYQHPPLQCDFQLFKHLCLASSLYSNTRHILIRSKTAPPQCFAIPFLWHSFIASTTMSVTQYWISLLNIMAVVIPSIVTPRGKGSPFPSSLLPISEIASLI